MRRLAWLTGLFLFASCSTTTDDVDPVQFTRVRVAPEAFLEDVPCSPAGGMELYQATLLDVTEGLDDAFALPSSDLTPCTAVVEFEFVEPGHRYIAEIRGFDRSDLETAAPGSTLVRTNEGEVVTERWSTTCWGQDGVSFEGSEAGGAGGARAELGAESFDKSVITVRGCDELQDSAPDDSTLVSINIESALVDLSCGDDAGEIARFDVQGPSMGEAGGAGGMASAPVGSDEPAGQRCGDSLIVDAQPDEPFRATVEGREGATGEVIWTSECHAEPVLGLTVEATCEPARGVEK